jgi:flagellar basal-body rod protein FlgF
MDKLVFVSMSGASQAMMAQAVEANNIANVATYGYKREVIHSKAVPVFGDYYQSRVFNKLESAGFDGKQGAIIATGSPLDVAVNGKGWFVVQDHSGNEAYTRAGSLTLDKNGTVMTSSGHVVMGNAGPLILPENQKVEIGADGTISVRPIGQGPEALVEADRMKLVKIDPKEMYRGLDGLFRRKDGEYANTDQTVRLATGVVEGSNVNAVSSLIKMINLSRQYEMQVKMMETAKELDQQDTQILKTSS